MPCAFLTFLPACDLTYHPQPLARAVMPLLLLCVCARFLCVITAAPTTTTTTTDRDDDVRDQQRQQQHSPVSVTLPIEQYHLVERLLQLEFPVAGPVEQGVPAALAHQLRKRTPPLSVRYNLHLRHVR